MRNRASLDYDEQSGALFEEAIEIVVSMSRVMLKCSAGQGEEIKCLKSLRATRARE